MSYRIRSLVLIIAGQIILPSMLPSWSAADDNNHVDVRDQIELIGVIEIAGSARDESGLNQLFDGGSSNNLLGGFSAVDYSRNNDRYYFLSDRGPDDGAVDWSCRFQEFQIDIPHDSTGPLTAKLVNTRILKNEVGAVFTGLASAIHPDARQAGRLDPEGIRVTSTGNVVISDEYGPRLIEFSKSGEQIREYSIPERYRIQIPGLGKSDENANNNVGRQANRGMEGLAVSSDGKSLFGLMQSPLLQDSDRDQLTGKPTGVNCRLLEIDTHAGSTRREYLYPLDDEKNKLTEIIMTDLNTFVVIERDGESGKNAQFKKLILATNSGSSDISGIERLPSKETPARVQPIKKAVLIDLLDPKWNLAGENMPEKVEGLAFGPNLPDGRRCLLVVSDNDFQSQNPSYVYVFAIPRKHLSFPVPIASTVTLEAD